MMQSLVPALYPILKDAYGLSFGQIGLITLAFQCTASMLQPVVGIYTDQKPQPYSLIVGMGFTLVGLLLMSRAGIVSADPVRRRRADRHGLVGLPSRGLARGPHGRRRPLRPRPIAVPGRRQLGRRSGPLLAAFIVVPRGQQASSGSPPPRWSPDGALLQVGGWYARRRVADAASSRAAAAARRAGTAPARAGVCPGGGHPGRAALLQERLQASLGSYFTFYLIDKFGLSVQTAQFFLFAFLVGIVAGTLAGGAVGDRVGRIPVMWFSILGALPFALMLPHANLFWTGVLAVLVGHDHGLGVLGHPGLCPGADARAASAWWPACSLASRSASAARRRGAGRARRPDQHRDRLPRAVPAAARLLTWFLPRQPGEPRNVRHNQHYLILRSTPKACVSEPMGHTSIRC